MKHRRALDPSSEHGRLRACVHDLVALSTMPSWWIGRSPAAIAESLRDTLARMLRVELTYVQVRDPATNDIHASAAGASVEEFEALLRAAGTGGPRATTLRAAPLVAAPIGLASELGWLAAGSPRSGFPSDTEAVLVEVAARQVAVALQHAALLARHEESERRLSARATEQEAVARLGLRALTGLALDSLLDEAVEVLRQTLAVDLCEVLEAEPDGGSLLLRAGAGWRAGLIGQVRVSSGAGSQAGYTLLVSHPVVVDDLRLEIRFAPSPLLVEHGVVSGMTVLIQDRDTPFGVLGVHARSPRSFTPDEVHFLQSMANLMAVAVQRHRGEVEREDLLARTLEAQAEAERASHATSGFLAMMSHELRTPLNAITGYVDLLDLGVHGPLTDVQRSDVARIRRCEEYVLSLINNVLAFMKLGSGHVRYEIEDVDVDETLVTVEEMIRPQMDEKTLRYERQGAGEGVRVRADGDKLRQIVLNLLSNATKFTDAGGTIRLDCAVEPEIVRIHVRDTGRGIPERSIERVFEPYVQIVDGDGRRGEGTGLGLAISRDFARGMGGDIRVESRLGEGSVFTVDVPRSH